MSQVLEQVHKELTFEDICPRWAAVLKKHPSGCSYIQLTQEEVRDLGRSESCIVGEAHKGGLYSCQECGNFSYGNHDFITGYSGPAVSHPEYWPKTIDLFMEHWNECHR